MDLLRKVRILVEALAHKPFTPPSEKAAGLPEEQKAHHDRAALAEPKPEAAETERVADLIARQRQGENSG